jgi:uncharacterized protein (DUF849 family)
MAKVMIEAAINGATMREKNPHVGYMPEEIAADAIACARAGAGIVHFHVREPNGKMSQDAGMYGRVMRLVRQSPDAPLLWPTFDLGPDVRKRFGHFAELAKSPETKSDFGACDMGSVNLVLWDQQAKTYAFNLTYENSIDLLIETLKYMKDLGHKRPTLQVFDGSFVRAIVRFLEMGLIEEPLKINFYFGGREMPHGLPPTPKALDLYVDMLEGARAHWFASAFGEDVMPLLSHAVALGGHCRVGLEDHHYAGEGKPGNVEIVNRATAVIREMGHEVATPADCRTLLEM